MDICFQQIVQALKQTPTSSDVTDPGSVGLILVQVRALMTGALLPVMKQGQDRQVWNLGLFNIRANRTATGARACNHVS